MTMLKTGSSRKKVDVSTFVRFDLSRYFGKWHEIARFDNWFERGLSDVSADYSLRGDGIVRVLNSGFDAVKGKRRVSVGKAKATKTAGLLRVSFFLWFYSDYRVLAVADDYSWSLVGSDDAGKYLWILAREKTLDGERLETILAEARRRGYDTTKLLRGQTVKD